MSDERAERLRNRRRRSEKKVKESAEDKPVKPDKASEPDKKEEDDGEGGVTPAKERDDWGAIQMRIPDGLRDDLEFALDETNLELKKEGEEKLEKLLHWYPLVVQSGIDAIKEMDVDEIKEQAKSFE